MLGVQKQFTATGYNTWSNTVYPLSATWTATGGTVHSGGYYTPTNYGDYTVTATCGTKSASAAVRVRFSLTGCEYRRDAGCLVLTWPSLAGRVYEVQQATNLAYPQWQVVVSNLVATPPQNQWPNVISPGAQRAFFRALDRTP